MKKIWIAGVTALMILGMGMQADAGFNLGGIANRAANKAANKAMDSIFSGGRKKKGQMRLQQSRASKLPGLK